jgi:hypothetical protein
MASGQDFRRVLTRTLGEYFSRVDPRILISQIDHHGPLLIFTSATVSTLLESWPIPCHRRAPRRGPLWASPGVNGRSKREGARWEVARMAASVDRRRPAPVPAVANPTFEVPAHAKVARLAIARQLQEPCRCTGSNMHARAPPAGAQWCHGKWAGPAQRRLRPGSNGGPSPHLSSGPALLPMSTCAT